MSISWSDVSLSKLVERLQQNSGNCHLNLELCESMLFEAAYSAEKGIYLRAKIDLPQGTEVLNDRALLLVAQTDLKRHCLRCACARAADGPEPEWNMCSACGHGWCSSDCRRASVTIHAAECLPLQRFPEVQRLCRQYDSVQYHNIMTMLRGLATCAAEPERWAHLQRLEDHAATAEACDDRFSQWHATARIVHEFAMSCSPACFANTSPADALQILLISNTNALRGSPSGHGNLDVGNSPIAIYPVFARLEHSCIPNLIFHLPDEGALQISVKTRVAIKKGESLSISYVLLDEPTHRRQQQLWQNKYFQCSCPRCWGAGKEAEVPGQICALLCSAKGCRGQVVPRSTKYYSSKEPWLCNSCGQAVAFKEIDVFEKGLLEKIDAAVSADDCEQILKSVRSRLSRNHFIRYLCRSTHAELTMRPLEVPIATGQVRKIAAGVVEALVSTYEDELLPWANKHLPKHVLQLHHSWCTLYYRLGQARLAWAMQNRDAALFKPSLSAYENALMETTTSMGSTFAAPLRQFVSKLRERVRKLQQEH